MRDLPIDPPESREDVEVARRYAEWAYRQYVERMLARDEGADTVMDTDERGDKNE